ncbi:hypothetical protein LI328DRAFT_165057 [Trichoderma asperelloides]|nr:hypothetical protein LI328DRAFT_165057 [Trichoderma asperelloides]
MAKHGPSRGCDICKLRKIKCDLKHPACSQCQKAKWTCPGARAKGPLGTITAAAGLAALANVGKSTEWKSQAYGLYGTAICQLQAHLSDPDRMRSDETLGAIMLMSIFEVIASADMDSMKSFSNHIIAAARCIDLRGPGQFYNGGKISARLFVQLRRIITMTCHQLQEPIPHPLQKWSSWAECANSEVEPTSNRFSELNGRLALARAEIKHKSITCPAVLSAILLPIDEMFEDWRRALPASWAFKSYHSLPSANGQVKDYMLQYDIYPDLYIASMWNSYRCIRLLIHESIIAAIVKCNSREHKERLYDSLKVLKAMADEVCHSVPYHLKLYRNSDCRPSDPICSEDSEKLPIPGGYLLFWPLFLSGMLRATPKDQREWIASTLRYIGQQMGIQLALFMASALERVESSFSSSETWFIGEFYPS